MASPDSNSRPPLATVDEDDHRAWVLISSSFGLAVILITTLIRLFIRIKVNPPFGSEDYVFFTGIALAIVHISVVYGQVNTGFGMSVDLIGPASLEAVQKFEYASDILFLAALYASKCCVVLFFRRMSPSRTRAITSWVTLSACVAFGIVSIAIVALRCDLTEPWLRYGGQCTGLRERWRTVAALDIISELGLFAMSLQLVWGLQTSLSNKAKVVFAFSFRLPLIIAAGVRLYHLELALGSPNPTLIGAITLIIAQTELFYSLVSATIPCLKPFLNAFVTTYGAMGADTVIGRSRVGGTTKQSQADSRASRNSFALRTLRSGKHAMGTKNDSAIRTTNHDVTEIDVEGRRSTDMIIKKEVVWHVDSESVRSIKSDAVPYRKEEKLPSSNEE